jgi:transposase InsO family protein
MRRSIRAYVRSCNACLRAKATRHKPYGLLKPLPVPVECWHDVSLDFVFGLPLSSGFDSILVVKDRLSKRAHYLPCLTTINAQEAADLFFREIFQLHGLPKTLVSDRGPQFASKFWKRLFEVLGVEIHLSTAFHPETDGSTASSGRVHLQ